MTEQKKKERALVISESQLRAAVERREVEESQGFVEPQDGGWLDKKHRLAIRIVEAGRKEFSVDARLADYEDMLLEHYLEMEESTLVAIVKQFESIPASKEEK